MQFKVPQNVQREDRIVGPLTLKQLIICGVGGGVAYAIYVSLGKAYLWITWLPPVAIVTIITVAFAFIKPLDLSFAKWLSCWIEFALLPRKRFWIKASGEVIAPMMAATTGKTKIEKQAEAKADALSEKQKKLDELTKFLESQKKTKNE
ncbi:MAG TPA: PrgI family protein [Candidatus Gracilibacteria bacterium]|nr:PrgI family protein [Candidatus Gracilibacteria bacterium]